MQVEVTSKGKSSAGVFKGNGGEILTPHSQEVRRGPGSWGRGGVGRAGAWGEQGEPQGLRVRTGGSGVRHGRCFASLTKRLVLAHRSHSWDLVGDRSVLGRALQA